MKTVYLGTSDFAVTVLKRLASSEHRPSLVVSRPDRPAGRGRKLQPPPVAVAARELGIPVFQPDKLSDDDATQTVLAEQADALVVCAYGAIVREPLLSSAPIYNVLCRYTCSAELGARLFRSERYQPLSPDAQRA